VEAWRNRDERSGEYCLGRYDLILTAYNFRQPHAAQVRDAIARAAARSLGIVAMKVMAGVFWDAERSHPINPSAALKWVLADPNVDTALMGCSNLDQLRTDLDILENPALTAREKDDLGFGERSGLAGLYRRQCGECRSQCPAGVDIPAWMRGFMYTYGYGSPARAKPLLGDGSLSIACNGFARCVVRYGSGFDVRSRILRLAPLRNVPRAWLA
jgi:hypothetical protein